MAVIVIQTETPESVEGLRIPMQIAANGYIVADDDTTYAPLIDASDGYLYDSAG